MVRMAQDFAMRLPLIDGQGNFGSMDGDRAAAMRYTEARLARPAHTLLDDIDRDTVDFQPNYDESVEPTVLPAQYPNLLVNGAGGIAVGMATNIPPHNLGEVIDACRGLCDTPDIGIDELIAQHVPGPDFPTGGIILGRRASIGLSHGARLGGHARPHRIEEIRKDRFAIVVTKSPIRSTRRADRAHRRGCATSGRGHRRPARRIRPRRRARGHRAEARRRARGRAQPAVPLHAAADQLRRQHAGADGGRPIELLNLKRSSTPSCSSARR
jgi:hypothetical protein